MRWLSAMRRACSSRMLSCSSSRQGIRRSRSKQGATEGHDSHEFGPRAFLFEIGIRNEHGIEVADSSECAFRERRQNRGAHNTSSGEERHVVPRPTHPRPPCGTFQHATGPRGLLQRQTHAPAQAPTCLSAWTPNHKHKDGTPMYTNASHDGPRTNRI